MPTLAKHTALTFSLEDVRDVLKRHSSEQKERKVTAIEETALTNGKNNRASETDKAQSLSKASPDVTKNAPKKHRRLEAASITDILGFKPNKKSIKQPQKIDNVPRKFSRYYRLLVNLRNRVQAGLEIHSRDTLNRSMKETSGNLSNYSQHMADVGTDNSDRDFGLSLVSNDRDILFEIEQAIDRIFDDSYGVCEITGKPISNERLMAIPFARFSREGQDQFEATGQKKGHRTDVLIESNLEK
jgi:RNA polymerase-binding transcription factor DksA